MPHRESANQAQSSRGMLPATRAGEGEEEEEREAGALAPRQLPGNHISDVTTGGFGASAGVDFGFGNSWSHISVRLPQSGGVDSSGSQSPPNRREYLPKGKSESGGSAGADHFARADGRQDAGDGVISDLDVRVGGTGASPDADGSTAGEFRTTSISEGQGKRAHAHTHYRTLQDRTGVTSRPDHTPAVGDIGRAPSPPSGPVSLPDDIYGAARVSEYWHGFPGLSSLASTYVYDDIWAGDGGLNPSHREDIMSIAAGAASGRGLVANQDGEGWGEGEAEVYSPAPQVGEWDVQSANSSPSRLASGNSVKDETTERAGHGRRRIDDASSSRSSGSGGDVDDGPDGGRSPAPNSSEEDGQGGWIADNHRDERSGGRSRGNLKGREDRGAGSNGEYGRKCWKDEAASACQTPGMPSPEADTWVMRGPDVARPTAGSPGAVETVEDEAAAQERALREAEMIRWCLKVSRPSAMPATGCDKVGGRGSGRNTPRGCGEKFYAERVLDPPPVPLQGRFIGGDGHVRSTERSVGGSIDGGDAGKGEGTMLNTSDGGNRSHCGCGGVRNGPSGGGDEAKARAEAAGSPSATTSSASKGSGSTAEIFTNTSAASAPADTVSAAELTRALSIEAAAAELAASTGINLAGAEQPGGFPCTPEAKHEAFFASHTLKPQPRWEWNIDRGVQGVAGHGGLVDSSDDAGVGRYTGQPRNELGHGDESPAMFCGCDSPAPGHHHATAPAAAVIKSSERIDWQVRPEAMMNYLTKVNGVPPPSLLHPARPRAVVAGAAAAGAQVHPPAARGSSPPPPSPPPSRGLSPSEDGVGGVVPDAGGGNDAAVAATAAQGRAAGARPDEKRTTDSYCEISAPNDWENGAGGGAAGGGGLGGGGNSAWGW